MYKDESHCLTLADMRSGKDSAISCFCRDSIADARYVYATYLLTGKDRNLNGSFLGLQTAINEKCGTQYESFTAAIDAAWKWNGPEVVRTYPSDEIIKRIPLEKSGRRIGRWVSFTVQLNYRDDHGRVTRTENYLRREFIPDSQ